MKKHKPANRIEEYDLRARYCKDDYLMSGRGEYDTDYRINRIVDRLTLMPHFRVLDIGPGSGRLFELIHTRVSECHGVEPADSIVERLSKKFDDVSNVQIHLAKSNRLHFDDDSFDIIVINGVLNLLDTKEEAIETLQEIRRVANESAIIFVGEFPFAFEGPGQLQGNGLQRTWRKIRQGNLQEVVGICFRKLVQTTRYLLRIEPKIIPSHTGINIPEDEFFHICRTIGMDGTAERTRFKYEIAASRNDYILRPATPLDPDTGLHSASDRFHSNQNSR